MVGPNLPNPARSVAEARTVPAEQIFFSHVWIWILQEGGIGVLRYASTSIKLKEEEETKHEIAFSSSVTMLQH